MSLRNAINRKCRECIADPSAAGTWRQQVEQCTVKTCPLYDVRPVSIGQSVNELRKSENGHFAPVSDIEGGDHAHR